MLQLLHIENIAVIERADISFRAGFNALTGETGAGKSIVIDSLGAVLGARTSRDLIRTGAAKAFVSAEFDGVDASLPVLAALGVEPEDGVLLLQRDIYADGKNICRANGRPITVAQLRALGTSLLNIHGQHEGTQLLDEEQHGAYLDRFARLDGLPEAYTERYQAARETRRQIEALEMDEAEKARRVDTLRHQIAATARRESFLRGASCCATPKSSWTPSPRRTTPSPAGTTASARRASSRTRRTRSTVCAPSALASPSCASGWRACIPTFTISPKRCAT